MPQFWIGFVLVLIGIVLVGIAAVLVRYFKEINAAHKRVEGLGSQVIETDLGSIEYVRVGEGYPVLVVHGAIGGFDQGLFLAKSFNLQNCEIIAISRFGHLRSPLPKNANLDMQANTYACLLDALKIRQALVFAISSGATSAIRFTARHPNLVKALVLMCPEAPGKVQMPLPPRFVFEILFRSNFVYWFLITYFGKSMQNMMSLVPKGYALTPESESRVKAVLQSDLPINKRIDGLIFETYTTAADMNESALDTSPFPLREIKTPVLIVNALDDPITLPENVHALAEKMPNARLFTLSDGGHLLFGHSLEVRSAIATFLRSDVAELKKQL
jgi:pimeloyl-ACP methyl ester carboxylesterase